jgi:hypothetical protein
MESLKKHEKANKKFHDGLNVYHCPRCLDVCHEKPKGEDPNAEVIERRCNYCLLHPEATSLEILKRTVEIMDNCFMSDFPVFIRRLVKHLDLKE